METKHTKGKWKITEKINGGIYKYIYVVCDNRRICEIKNPFSDESEANAKLIASAPDLLEACMEAKAMYEAQGINELTSCFRIGGYQYDRLLNAINKATK